MRARFTKGLAIPPPTENHIIGAGDINDVRRFSTNPGTHKGIRDGPERIKKVDVIFTFGIKDFTAHPVKETERV